MKTSHDYASSLERLAAFLKSNAPFAINDSMATASWNHFLFSDKVPFLSLVRAIHGGKKQYDEFCGTPEIAYEVKLPTGESVCFRVYRDSVCRLVKPATPAEYDCEPLLAVDDNEALETASAK